MNKQQIIEASASLLEALATTKANLQGEFSELISALWLANGANGLTVPAAEGTYTVSVFGLENFDLATPAQRNKYFSTIGRNAQVEFSFEKQTDGTTKGVLSVNGAPIVTKNAKKLLELISLQSMAEAYQVWLKQTGENIGGAHAGQRGRLPEKDILALVPMLGGDYQAIANEVDRDPSLVRDFLVKSGVKVG